MEKLGGPLGVTAIAVVAALVVCLAVLHFGFHAFRRRKGRSRAKPGPRPESKSGILSDSRVEVLETTIIDAERKLVLIRCDRIEHLVMIGGPADVVVENDVRKVRGPGAPPAKIPGFETEKRTSTPARSTAATSPDAGIAPTPKPPEPHRPAPRAADARAQVPPRSLPNPPARAGVRTADVPPPARADDAAHHRAPPPQRPQPADSAFSRRDAAPVRRAPLTQHPPAPTGRAAEPIRPPAAPANDRNARTARSGGRAEPAGSLPAAQIPWSDPDSIENEIVRALRFDPHTRGGDQTPGRREGPSAKAMTDSQTTLGDLADRLEEALAREVQSARQPQRTDSNFDEFGFENDAGSAGREPPKPSAQKERPTEKRERSEPQRAPMAAAPEPDVRREPREPPAPAERREEAPVISLNSRRRESADQLEDEMARLLGELTSDNKGR